MHKVVGQPGTIVSLLQLKEKFCAFITTDNKSNDTVTVKRLRDFGLITDCGCGTQTFKSASS
jgi:hypothetical protein